jgi:hypothetical protein
MSTYEDYRQAAALLWGEAGDFAAAEFARLNREHFACSVPPIPLIIGLTAFGKCIGATRDGGWLDSPRITLAPELFNGNHRTAGGPRMISDTLVHEMVHAALMLRGEDPNHNGEPWCRLITELSPDLLGHEITARPVRPRRVPNPDRAEDQDAPKTIVIRKPEPGAMSQDDLARWPLCLRPGGYYLEGKPIPVPTY